MVQLSRGQVAVFGVFLTVDRLGIAAGETHANKTAPARSGTGAGGGTGSGAGQGGAADSTAQRLLDVLETVCRFGPITLSDLCDRVNVPRGAVWRALSALREKGWVRMRHGDKAYELCAALSGLFAQGHFARPEVEAVMPVFTRLAESGPLHVDLGLFTARGHFHIVETTRKDGYARQSLSLTDEDIAIAAQLHLSPADIVRHLTVFMETASAEERQVIASGEHNRTVRRLRGAGIMWQDDGSSAAFGLRRFPGMGLRVELWRPSRQRAQSLRELVDTLLAEDAG